MHIVDVENVVWKGKGVYSLFNLVRYQSFLFNLVPSPLPQNLFFFNADELGFYFSLFDDSPAWNKKIEILQLPS